MLKFTNVRFIEAFKYNSNPDSRDVQLYVQLDTNEISRNYTLNTVVNRSADNEQIAHDLEFEREMVQKLIRHLKHQEKSPNFEFAYRYKYDDEEVSSFTGYTVRDGFSELYYFQTQSPYEHLQVECISHRCPTPHLATTIEALEFETEVIEFAIDWFRNHDNNRL